MTKTYVDYSSLNRQEYEKRNFEGQKENKSVNKNGENYRKRMNVKVWDN
jgi:hypothetical protein